jgi:hypothetical protein
MICARCDKPIEGEPERIEVDTGTGPGGDVYVCPVYCRPAPRQTSPRQ